MRANANPRKIRKDKGIPATHGYTISHRNLYVVYYTMRRRCYNQNDPAYPNYGGRGIYVDQVWDKPRAFCEWALENGYKRGLTLERLDNNKGYSPDNCGWVNRFAQCRNRRSNRIEVLNDEAKPLAEWAELYGVPMGRLHRRLTMGWDLERALTQPSRLAT
jgi:hypothetical protein